MSRESTVPFPPIYLISVLCVETCSEAHDAFSSRLYVCFPVNTFPTLPFFWRTFLVSSPHFPGCLAALSQNQICNLTKHYPSWRCLDSTPQPPVCPAHSMRHKNCHFISPVDQVPDIESPSRNKVPLGWSDTPVHHSWQKKTFNILMMNLLSLHRAFRQMGFLICSLYESPTILTFLSCYFIDWSSIVYHFLTRFSPVPVSQVGQNRLVDRWKRTVISWCGSPFPLILLNFTAQHRCTT